MLNVYNFTQLLCYCIGKQESKFKCKIGDI